MNYTLDASALMALIEGETGQQKVKDVLISESPPSMHEINLFEVKYKIQKRHPEKWPFIKKRLGKINVLTAQILTEEIMEYAQYLKSKYKLSLADSIGLGLNHFLGTTFLTCDRHELETIAENERVKIEFLR